MSEMATREELVEACEKINGAEFDPNSHADLASMFLLGALCANTTEADRVARTFDIPRKACREFAARARANGIFIGPKIHAAWMDEEGGGVSFICDSLVCAGLLERVKDDGA